MRKKGKLIGLGVVLAAVAAMFAAGSVYAAPPDATPNGPKTGLTLTEMRNILVPLSGQPESRFVHGPMTLKQAAAENAFASPPGMVFSPRSCATYLEDVLGSMSTLDGWIQFGSRVHETHNDNFIQAIVNIPGGVDLNRIRDAVSTCKTGTLTLDGQTTGAITYTENAPPSLPGSQTFSVTGKTQFSATPGTAAYDAVKRYEMPPDAQLLVGSSLVCIAATNFVGTGETLIVTLEADPQFSTQIATQMQGLVMEALGAGQLPA